MLRVPLSDPKKRVNYTQTPSTIRKYQPPPKTTFKRGVFVYFFSWGCNMYGFINDGGKMIFANNGVINPNKNKNKKNERKEKIALKWKHQTNSAIEWEN